MKKMKKSWLAAAVSLAVFAGFGAGIAKAQSSPPMRDIGGEVRGVFATRCAAAATAPTWRSPRAGSDTPRPPTDSREPRNGDPPTTDRVRAVGYSSRGTRSPRPTRRKERSRRCKRKSFGHGSPLVPRTLPRCLGFPSFSPIRTDDPSTHRDGPGGSVHPLAGQVSPATAPLPDCSCPGGWGRRGSVGVATKSDSVGIGSILLMARGSCRDPTAGLGWLSQRPGTEWVRLNS